MAIRWDKLTVKAQEAFSRANDLASEHGNPELRPLHVLAALLEDREGIIVPLLSKMGVRPEAVQQAAMREIERLPKVSGSAAQATLSNEAQDMLDRAFKQADQFKDEYVSTEHILLGMAQLKRDAAKDILGSMGANYDAILKALTGDSRQSEGDRPESRGEVPGAGALCARSHRACAPRQARSRDRPRRRSASRGAGAFP